MKEFRHYPRLRIIPIPLATAQAYVAQTHRHHQPPKIHKFCIGVADEFNKLSGVLIAGHPCARILDDGWTCEVSRVATDGAANACSMLYGAAARIAKAMGFARIITYTLHTEPGTTLRAAGWTNDHRTKGHDGWKNRAGFDRASFPTIDKHRWCKVFAETPPHRVARCETLGPQLKTELDFEEVSA